MTNGWESERISHELTWDRVANVNGGRGTNIGLDLLNEFLNNDFKGMHKSTSVVTLSDKIRFSLQYFKQFVLTFRDVEESKGSVYRQEC